VAAGEGSAHVSDAGAVDPDDGGVVDAFEVEPDVAAGVGGGDGDDGAVPVGRFIEGFRDDFGAVVFAVHGVRVDAGFDERLEDGAGDDGGVPGVGVVGGGGDDGAGVGRVGNVGHAPAGGDGGRCGKRLGLCGADAQRDECQTEPTCCACGHRETSEIGAGHRLMWRVWVGRG